MNASEGKAGQTLPPPQTYSARDDMPGVARVVLANQLAIIQFYEDPLRQRADMVAVHETRKAIRRSRTAFRVFAPYFPKKTFRPFRRGLKQTMKELGDARDLAVFVTKLEAHAEALGPGEREDLLTSLPFWRDRLREANERARAAITSRAHRDCVAQLARFLAPPRRDPPVKGGVPCQVRHLAPVHIYQRLASVRAYDVLIARARPEDLHRLRVQFKELRYTLAFFAPILDEGVNELVAHLNQIQDHLGDLNDAHVALRWLQRIPPIQEKAITPYRAHQRHLIQNLVDSFADVWDEFNNPDWRRRLGVSIAAL